MRSTGGRILYDGAPYTAVSQGKDGFNVRHLTFGKVLSEIAIGITWRHL